MESLARYPIKTFSKRKLGSNNNLVGLLHYGFVAFVTCANKIMKENHEPLCLTWGRY